MSPVVTSVDVINMGLSLGNVITKATSVDVINMGLSLGNGWNQK